MNARITATDISKCFPGVEVLRELALSVAVGEVVAVLGASGTGKSTLLNILGLLDEPDSGYITIDGKRMDQLPAAVRAQHRARSLGFVFQGFHLLPEFDVLENVLMPARCAGGVSRSHRQRAEQLLANVGLAERRHHDVRKLSGGEAQRVALCRAVLLKPPVLLADEPTGNLDPATATIVLQLLLDLARQDGSSVVIVTHDHAVAERADRQLELHDGQLHETTSEELPA